MDFEEAKEKIKDIADKNTRFKIGKTGQALSERFSSEYESEYDDIVLICKSSKASAIDDWEKRLITYFKDESEYKDKCDNDAEGGGDMADDSATYRVYVVKKA